MAASNPPDERGPLMSGDMHKLSMSGLLKVRCLLTHNLSLRDQLLVCPIARTALEQAVLCALWPQIKRFAKVGVLRRPNQSEEWLWT